MSVDRSALDAVASMLRNGKGFDDSDIMPGSEFDGPVVL